MRRLKLLGALVVAIVAAGGGAYWLRQTQLDRDAVAALASGRAAPVSR